MSSEFLYEHNEADLSGWVSEDLSEETSDRLFNDSFFNFEADKPGEKAEAPKPTVFNSTEISEDVVKDLVKVKGQTAEHWRKVLGDVQKEIEKGAKEPDAA